MTVSPRVPNSTIKITTEDGQMTLPWRRFFQDIASGGSADLGPIEAEIAAIVAELTGITASVAVATATAETAVEVASQVEGLVAATLDLTPSGGSSTLAGLSDVNVTEGLGIDGYALVWNNATSKWIASLIAGGGSWLPVVSGAEPPVFITDGAGVLITVAYSP